MDMYYKGRGRFVVNSKKAAQKAMTLLFTYDPSEWGDYGSVGLFAEKTYGDLDHVGQLIQAFRTTDLVPLEKFTFDWERLCKDMHESGHQIIFIGEQHDEDQAFLHTRHGQCFCWL